MTEKAQQEKNAAERQVALLTDALESARTHEGIWLNTKGKAAPRFYPRGVSVSAFNAVILGLHSDQNGYKTNEYTLFSEAKKRGESVQAKEKGVPFLWYNWKEYENRHNPDEQITREQYQQLTPEEQKMYKGVRQREVRMLFNIEQTTFPMVDKNAFAHEVELFGGLSDREDVAREQQQLQKDVNLFILHTRDNLVPIRKDASGVSHYDAQRNAVYMAPQKSYGSYEDYVRDLVKLVVTATGHQQRLAREGMLMDGGKKPSEDAARQEQLVVELATGAKLQELGLPARISPENLQHIDFWKRELNENPCLVDALEMDVNNALDVIHKAERNEKVEYATDRAQQQTEEIQQQLPQHFYIADEIKSIPNQEKREMVIVRDSKAKTAEVILPAGASLEPKNELPGMSKERIKTALRKEGFYTVTFYNPDGALGYRPDDRHFEGKEVTVTRLNNWTLENVQTLDVSDAVKKAALVDFDSVMMLRDDDGKWALYLKPENERGFAVYPDKPDINTFFSLIRNPTPKTEAFRLELARKYHALATARPDLKIDLFKSDATEEELGRIERVNIFKTRDDKAKILCAPKIAGLEKVQPRLVTHDQWQRMWLAPDMQDYKKHLAASLFADVLRQGRSDAVAVGTDKTEQEGQAATPQETKQVVTEHKEEQEHEQREEEQQTEQKEKDEKEKLRNSPEQKKKEEQEEKAKEEATKAETKAVAAVVLTPMLKQFYDLKSKHPDAVLLFRAGDFYETYGEDARAASQTLGITLTRSNSTKGKDGKPLEMAGFPYHALDAYLPKLIRAGHRVAICDQLEAPRQTSKRSSVSSPVSGEEGLSPRQEVKEIVTPQEKQESKEDEETHREVRR